MQRKIHPALADSLLLLVTAFWGSTFFLTKKLTQQMDVVLYMGLRFLLASIVFIPFILQQLKKMTKEDLKRSLFLGFILWLAFIFQFQGIQYTTASNSAFITGFCVILVPIFVAIYDKKLPAFYSLLGSILALIGASMMALNEFELNIGDLLTFICAIFFALQIILTANFSRKTDVYVLTFIELLVVAILSFAITPITGINAQFDLESIFILIFLAIVCSSFSYLMQTYMQRFTTPAKTAVIFSMEPVFGAIVARLFGNEILSFVQWIGASLILTGMLTSEAGELVLYKLVSLFKKEKS